jgi:hypothetical protein
VTLRETIEITNYTGKETDIVIPAQIENLPVTDIRGRSTKTDPKTGRITIIESTFENKGLTSVIFPNALQKIHWGAFADNNITELHFNNNLILIDNLAFINNRITTVTIPDNVSIRIGAGAFEGNQIKTLTIGNRVEYIGSSAFRNNKIMNLAIPASVTTVGIHAFASNEITELYLMEGLITISNYAFENNRLTELVIPAGIIIRNRAFMGNIITRLNIGKNVWLHPYDSLPMFELNFDKFFLENYEQSGNYIYEEGKWEFLADG